MDAKCNEGDICIESAVKNVVERCLTRPQSDLIEIALLDRHCVGVLRNESCS